MAFTEEEKKVKVSEITKSLDAILEKKPYILLISVLEDYSEVDGKINAKTWSIQHQGNASFAIDPFVKMNFLVNSLISLFDKFMKKIVGGQGENKE